MTAPLMPTHSRLVGRVSNMIVFSILSASRSYITTSPMPLAIAMYRFAKLSYWYNCKASTLKSALLLNRLPDLTSISNFISF